MTEPFRAFQHKSLVSYENEDKISASLRTEAPS